MFLHDQWNITNGSGALLAIGGNMSGKFKQCYATFLILSTTVNKKTKVNKQQLKSLYYSSKNISF